MRIKRLIKGEITIKYAHNKPKNDAASRARIVNGTKTQITLKSDCEEGSKLHV